MVQRTFMQSAPNVLHPAIFMLLVLKHCYLLNCKKLCCHLRNICRLYLQTKQLTEICFLSSDITKSSDPLKCTFSLLHKNAFSTITDWTKVLCITYDKLTSPKHFYA